MNAELGDSIFPSMKSQVFMKEIEYIDKELKRFQEPHFNNEKDILNTVRGYLLSRLNAYDIS